MMTATEAKAHVLAIAIARNNTTFAAADYKLCGAALAKLLADGKIDSDTFVDANSWLGNCSAVSQWLTKHGFITVAPDALHHALDRAMEEQAKIALKGAL